MTNKPQWQERLGRAKDIIMNFGEMSERGWEHGLLEREGGTITSYLETL